MKCASAGSLEGSYCLLSHSIARCRPCRGDWQSASYFSGAQHACVRYQNDPVLAFCGEGCKGDADCSAGFGCREAERVDSGAVLQSVRVDPGGERVLCPEVPAAAP